MKKILIPIALIGLCLSCEIANSSPASDARQNRKRQFQNALDSNIRKPSGNIRMAPKSKEPNFLSKIFGATCFRPLKEKDERTINFGYMFH